MRTTLALMASTAAVLCSAQWSLDPANPMVLCDATGDQAAPKVIGDGSSGWFVFWSDARSGNTHRELYGQHLDEDGNALWEPNGRLVFSLPWTSVNDAAIARISNGDMMIAVISKVNTAVGADTVRAILIDDEAQAQWAEPALLSVYGQGIFGNCFGFDIPQAIESGDGAFFCYHGDSQGSNGYYVMQRVRADGSVAFAVPGLQVPNNAGYGPFQIRPDGADGMIAAWRCSNGGGTCHLAMRVDSLGNNVWANNLNVAAGGAGLSYEFTTLPDGTGAQISAWEESGGDIGMARYDTTGAMLWTPAPFYACTEGHTQASPALAISGDHLFVAWRDSRPDSSGLFIQMFDLAGGTPQWTTNGLPVIIENFYIPTARIVPSDSGAVIGAMDMTGPHKYCAMRVRSDGSLAWPEPVPFATSNGPFYGDRTELPDGDGGVVAFWRDQGGDLFGARIYRDGAIGNHIGMGTLPAGDPPRIFPNPAEDRITVVFTDRGTKRSIDILSVDGRVRIATGAVGERVTIDVSGLPPGAYLIRTIGSGSSTTGRFIKR